jgi:glutaconate CoA-transferase subunit B
MITAIARAVRDGDRVGVGVNSPIPAAAVLLARELHAPNAVLRLPGSDAGEAFLGSKEFFDMAQRGRIDLFFHSGVQIDRHANLNLHVLGDYERPRRRFAGAFGSAVLYQVVGRVILFRTEHSPRTLVDHVDFITAAPGNPDRLVTPRAVLTWDATARELVLASYSPGESVDSVRAATGWPLAVRSDVRETEAPTRRELELLRGPVLDQLEAIYPRYVEARRETAGR